MTMPRRAVFLDRDGVLCREKGHISRSSDLELFDFAAYCVDNLHKDGWLCIVVTNQSGVARGIVPVDELLKMNRRLVDEVGVDKVYFCPHHVDGVVAEYAISCGCRKPKTGMIDKARRDFDINIASSYMIGDRASDVQLGQAAGLKTVLLESGYGTERLEQEVHPDLVMRDLREFTEYIINANGARK